MATCNNCVHSGICAIQLEPHYVLDRAQKLMRESNNVEHECLYFKDRSRFVELPCKIENKLYLSTESRNKIIHLLGVMTTDPKLFEIVPERKIKQALKERENNESQEAIQQTQKEVSQISP
ncbi:MAG TPA: hypothetical protein DCG28_01380 [Lachnospiraceae bacterium]|nr:hypothetical protein [Lachnospiraceae bacterium]